MSNAWLFWAKVLSINVYFIAKTEVLSTDLSYKCLIRLSRSIVHWSSRQILNCPEPKYCRLIFYTNTWFKKYCQLIFQTRTWLPIIIWFATSTLFETDSLLATYFICYRFFIGDILRDFSSCYFYTYYIFKYYLIKDKCPMCCSIFSLSFLF